MRIAGETPRGGIDEVHVPRDERGKGGLGFGAGEFGEQFVVIQFSHLPNDVREPRNWTNYFAFSTTGVSRGPQSNPFQLGKNSSQRLSRRGNEFKFR